MKPLSEDPLVYHILACFVRKDGEPTPVERYQVLKAVKTRLKLINRATSPGNLYQRIEKMIKNNLLSISEIKVNPDGAIKVKQGYLPAIDVAEFFKKGIPTLFAQGLEGATELIDHCVLLGVVLKDESLLKLLSRQIKTNPPKVLAGDKKPAPSNLLADGNLAMETWRRVKAESLVKALLTFEHLV